MGVLYRSDGLGSSTRPHHHTERRGFRGKSCTPPDILPQSSSLMSSVSPRRAVVCPAARCPRISSKESPRTLTGCSLCSRPRRAGVTADQPPRFSGESPLAPTLPFSIGVG